MANGMLGKEISCHRLRVFSARPDRDPPELADEPTLPAYLGVPPKELKKVWYRGRMYQHFSIAKGPEEYA